MTHNVEIWLRVTYSQEEFKEFARDVLAKFCSLLGNYDPSSRVRYYIMELGTIRGYLIVWLNKEFEEVESDIIEETTDVPTELSEKKPKTPIKVNEIVRKINYARSVEEKLELIKQLLGEKTYKKVIRKIEALKGILKIVAQADYREIEFSEYNKFRWYVRIYIWYLNAVVKARLIAPCTILSANVLRRIFKKIQEIRRVRFLE